MNIEIDSGSVQNMYSQLNDKKDDFIAEIGKLSNVVDNIGTAWQGADATKYIEAMQSYVNALKYLTETIKQYNEYLYKVPGLYDALDDAYSNKNIKC